jgi:hypothetical protein
MSRPVLPRPMEGGPRMPASLLRRRPAEIVVPRPLPPTPPAPARRPVPRQRRRPLPPPRPARGRRPIPVGLIAAALVFVGLFAVAAGLGAATNLDLAYLLRGPDKPPPRAFPVLDPSHPVRLTIPSLKVAAPILDVGLAADGTVGVPPLNRHHEAGWFDQGPTPGQFGPALIVGHADTRTGPSIFHNLGSMRAGQRVEVLRRDHTVAIFEVNSIEHFGKGKLPIQRVYGDYRRPSLRLVTCGGTWLGGDQGYSDNVIVFASLVDSRRA